MDTLSQDFSAQLKFSEEKVDEEMEKVDQEDEENDDDHEHDEYDDEEPYEDDEFSFVFDGVNMTAEETRLVFPLFNTDLLSNERLPVRPPVKHVYAETSNEHPVASSSSGEDAIAGPCCEWSKDKAAAGAGGRPGGCCKKSNSTGFSKLWRFKEFVHRSHSDGRDAFVFLNHPSTSKPKLKVAEKKIASAVKVNAKVGGENNETAQQKKTKNATALAHERYMKSKAKDEERRRSYLPYRPELVGFFTTVNGGLTKNIHPY